MKLFSTEQVYKLRLKYLRHFGQPILIWNMGKVASTSIAKSLWQTQGRSNILTTHFMNDIKHKRSVHIYNNLIKNYGRKLPIITLTRSPIERNISSFFQNFQRNTGYDPSGSSFSTHELIDIFNNKFDKQSASLKLLYESA